MTELGHYMRQQRLTAGVDTMKYATKLVERAMRPAPGKPLDEDHLANVERGNSGVNEPMWREKGKPDVGPPRVYVPYELAEAYDTAFGADGYLADVYDWAWVRDHEHEQSPPRAMPPIPAELTLDAALRVLWDGFAPQDEVAGPLLAGREAAVRAAYPGWQDPARADAWVPAEGGRDRSAFVNELNEFRDGQLTAPGAVVSGSWPLRNMGEIPWRDRLLFRVSQRDAGGIHAPRFVPVPDTDPGEVAVIRAPLRAPRRPGTYQVCFKIGWPSGVYCHPTTITGVMATLIVPPREVSAWWPDPVPAAGSGQAPQTLMTDPGLGPLLSAARKKARLTQAQLGALLTDIPAGRRSLQAVSFVERGNRQWPLSAWHAAVRALEPFGDAAPEVAALRSRLPSAGHSAPATTWTPGDRRDHLRAMLADLTATPPRRRFARTGTQETWSPYPAAGEILRRLDAGSPERPSAQDRWEMIGPSSHSRTDIGKKEYFAIQVTLRNTGEIPWEGRLLSRLGVAVSTVMPMTPRVIPVPRTEPGGTCSVSIPGRPAHLTGVTDIHFIMTFADLRPCFPGDRRTICLTLATTTTVGAQETLPVPARLAQAARTLIGRLRRTEDSHPLQGTGQGGRCGRSSVAVPARVRGRCQGVLSFSRSR
jgi:hypothetical protein